MRSHRGWAMLRFVLRRGLGIALGAALLACPAAVSAPRVAFTSDVGGRIELPAACPSQDSEAWPMLAADPGDPARLLGVVQVGGVMAAAAVASSDGGRSWRREPIADATRCAGGPPERQFSVNPLVATGAGGAGYHGQSWVRFDPGEEVLFGIAVHALGSGGPAGVPDFADSSQNAAVVADPKLAGRIGLLWADLDQLPNPFTYAPSGSRIRFASSDDGGATWRAPIVLYEPGPELSVVNARIVRAGDGALVALWDVFENADLPAAFLGLPLDVSGTIFTARSEDRGRTWSTPVVAGTHELIVVDDPDHDAPREIDTVAASAKPSLAAGPDGRLALTVAGRRGADGRSAVRLATSDDGGRTWSPQVDGFAVDGHLIQPEVAFDRKGRLGVAFYDSAEDVPDDGDGWEITPRVAVRQRGEWHAVALSEPFDLHQTNSCSNPTGLALPFGTSCELTVDATAIGVYPSIVGLPSGFGAGFSVGPPVASDGFTDARYARVKVR